MSQTSKFLPLSLSIAVAIALTTVASPARAVSLWTYNFNHFALSSPQDGAHDWEDQVNAVGLFTGNPNEGWTVQGSSSSGRSRGNVIANPYGPGNIIQSVWPQTTPGGHLKAWHGYTSTGSGNLAGGIQPYITDMATADLVKYTFDVQTGTNASGSGNKLQWQLGAYTLPGNRAADFVFQVGYYDPFISSGVVSGGVNWQLVTPAGTFTSTTKPFFYFEHLLVEVLVDLVANTASVSFGVSPTFTLVPDASLQNISLGAVNPRLGDEIYFDSHGGQVVSLQVETITNVATVPEPASFWLAGIGLSCAALSLALRRR